MRLDAATAQVMKNAARGPAAIALRQQRILRPTQTGVSASSGVIQGTLGGPGMMGTGRRRASFGAMASEAAGARLVGGGVGSQSMGAARLVSSGTGGVPGGLTGYFVQRGSNFYRKSSRLPPAFAGFGAFGIATTTEQYGKQAGEVAGTAVATGAVMGTAATATAAGSGAAGMLSAAGYGSLIGPVGAVVGLIIGIAIAKILKKNYLNVPQINAMQDAQVDIFDKYKSIQGKVPGRAIGMDVMKAIWKGAQNRGYFGTHGAGIHQCFHEGCFKYPGRGDWIDSDYSTSGASWQWGGVLRQWQAGRQAGAAAVQVNTAARSVIIAPHPAQIRQVVSLRGLGSLGAVQTVADAVTFVDNYFIPANQNRWAAPSNTFEHNMLYDLADAFLAAQPGISTTPYVANPQAPPAPPAATTPAPAVTPAASPTQATTSYPGYTYLGTDAQGHQLYLSNADGALINQNIPIYTPVAGVMTPTGQTFFNGATVPSGPVVQPAPQPGNTYPLTPVQTPSGTTVYQQNPNATQAAPAAAAPGTNWGPIIALAAGAMAFMR